MIHSLALGWPGPFEMIIIAGLGLLIFGKRLPEVGRSIGKTIVEFKKGMKEVEKEVEEADQEVRKDLPASSASRPALNQPAYQYDPQTGKPLNQEQPSSKA